MKFEMKILAVLLCTAALGGCSLFSKKPAPAAAPVASAAPAAAPALNTTQDVYVSDPLKTGRIMAKDEDVCLHCGLCAERCPTGAWDMQKSLLKMTHAGPGCRGTPQRKAA